jgi:hypothetical protein
MGKRHATRAGNASQRDGQVVGRNQPIGGHRVREGVGTRRVGRRRATRAESGEQCRHDVVGLGRDHAINRRKTLIVHAPATVQLVVERNLDDARTGFATARRLQRPGEIHPIQAEDNVGFRYRAGKRRSQQNARGVDMQRVVRWKRRTDLEVGTDICCESLCQRDTRCPCRQVARYAPDQQQRTLGVAQEVRRAFDAFPGSRAGCCRHIAGGGDRRHRLRKWRFLQFGVEIHVDRPLRRALCVPHRA